MLISPFCLHSTDMVLDQQVSSGQLNEDVRHRVHEALMKQHHHQNQKKLTNRIPIVRSFADIGKKQSEPNSMDKNGKCFFIVLIVYYSYLKYQSPLKCILLENDLLKFKL